MFRLRFLLVLVACSCAAARNMERREEHHHPLPVVDNSTLHRHGESARPVADNPTSRRAIEQTTASNKSIELLTEELTSAHKRDEKKFNSSSASAPHPKRSAGPSIAAHRAEPGCCG